MWVAPLLMLPVQHVHSDKPFHQQNTNPSAVISSAQKLPLQPSNLTHNAQHCDLRPALKPELSRPSSPLENKTHTEIHILSS